VHSVAGGLAQALWSFHDDDALWKQLRSQTRLIAQLSDEQRVELRIATDIDWTPLLLEAGYEPPPPAWLLADEFRMDVQQAFDRSGDVDIGQLRERVADLATRLDRARADERPGHFQRLVTSVRIALPGALRVAVVNGVASAVGLGVAVALSPVVPLAPAGGAAAGAATRFALDRALPHAHLVTAAPDSPSDLRELVRQELRPETFFRASVDLEILARVQAEDGRSFVVAAMQDGYVSRFESALAGVDRALATTLLLLDRAVDTGDPELRSILERMADALGCLRRVLADLEEEHISIDALIVDLRTDATAVFKRLTDHHS
jgi:hypothetical protein